MPAVGRRDRSPEDTTPDQVASRCADRQTSNASQESGINAEYEAVYWFDAGVGRRMTGASASSYPFEADRRRKNHEREPVPRLVARSGLPFAIPLPVLLPYRFYFSFNARVRPTGMARAATWWHRIPSKWT
jgi:hypothetical protein